MTEFYQQEKNKTEGPKLHQRIIQSALHRAIYLRFPKYTHNSIILVKNNCTMSTTAWLWLKNIFFTVLPWLQLNISIAPWAQKLPLMIYIYKIPYHRTNYAEHWKSIRFTRVWIFTLKFGYFSYLGYLGHFELSLSPRL